MKATLYLPMTRKPETQQRNLAIVRAWEAGERAADIAARYGLKTSRVNGITARYGADGAARWRAQGNLD